MISEPTARYKHAVTYHQGFIEGLLLSVLENAGVKVERPCKPTNLELSASADGLTDPSSYPVKVRIPASSLARNR